MVILAMDPGRSGALAVLDTENNEVSCYDMPLAPDGNINVLDLCHLLDIHDRYDAGVIEHAHTMPADGRVSAFRYGTAFGIQYALMSIVLARPPALVAPQKWKAYFKIGKDKQESLRLAKEKWPHNDDFTLKKHHNRAEAALLALYYASRMV